MGIAVNKKPRKSKPDYLGHRQRLMEKYRKTGLSGWHDYEILEFILTYVIPVRDTKPVARSLLRKFRSLGDVFNACEKELVEIEGIGPRSAMFLSLFREVASI
jgi:DNA repair protein RadC